MLEARVRLHPDGSVLIPAAFRKALGLKAGDEVALRRKDDELCVTTVKGATKRARPNTESPPATKRRRSR